LFHPSRNAAAPFRPFAVALPGRNRIEGSEQVDFGVAGRDVGISPAPRQFRGRP
jgi:hypothetical protein